MTKKHLLVAMLLVLASGIARAEIEALTTDGKRVLLRDDFTWEFLGEADAAKADQLTLRLLRMSNLTEGCQFGLRLENHAHYKIMNIVPQLSAYTPSGLLLATQFISFAGVNPTRDQYRVTQFKGFPCPEIGSIKVHGADRCAMDDLDRYSSVRGECLNRVLVEKSNLMKISK